MNANELAEQLDEYAGNSGYSHNDYADSMSQAATMLRQQQAEIEALKAHPVKELTDKEIDTIVRDFFGEVDSFYDFRLVIRRCIRKAQE